MKKNQKQIEAVTALPGQKRYEHFVKVVADWEEVWGLYQDGWALAATDDGQQVFPCGQRKNMLSYALTRNGLVMSRNHFHWMTFWANYFQI